MAFARTPPGCFAKGLELGAGDCYQSQYLTRYVVHLTCTDLDEARMMQRGETPSNSKVTYRTCDAEDVNRVFADERFDLFFTSNMLPHTPNPQAVLTAIRQVSTRDAVLVVIVPSVSWKIAKLMLFYPRLLLSMFRRLWTAVVDGTSGKTVTHEERRREIQSTNNVKVRRLVPRWRKRLLPMPIGAYEGNVAELLGSRRARWSEELRRAGWYVIRVSRGPFIVGELSPWWNAVAGRLGLSTEHVFLARQKDIPSKFEGFFL